MRALVRRGTACVVWYGVLGKGVAGEGAQLGAPTSPFDRVPSQTPRRKFAEERKNGLTELSTLSPYPTPLPLPLHCLTLQVLALTNPLQEVCGGTE